MAMETYFDFDAETFQITERKRLSSSSGEVPPTPGISSPYIKSTCSEDTGFETSSDRSSQDGVPLLESPRSPCLKTSINGFLCSTCPRASLDSLVSRPIRRYDSKDSVKSTSSFWESNFPPETKAVLSKIRDQMRSSLEKVRKLEEEAKQIPLLQVKISTLQEEKRQLKAQLECRHNLKKSRSRSSSMSHSRSSSIDDLINGFQDKGTRSIGVGEDTVHDILCEKCKEIQSKLLGHSCGVDVGCCHDVPHATEDYHVQRKEIKDDDIKVFQDRCTQTRTSEYKHNSIQTIASTRDSSTSIDAGDSSRVMIRDMDIMTKKSSCDPIPVQSRSVGVGQMKSFLKDACVGENRDIPSYADNSVQNVVSTSDKSCGVQIQTENIGVNVCPAIVSIGTGCNSNGSTANIEQRSIGSQTAEKHINLMSVGVGMFSIDESADYECSKCNSSKSLSIDEILESNEYMNEENTSVAVGTPSWVVLERQILLDYQASRSTASVAVETRIDSRTVGCGERSVTDVTCQNCTSKSTRSLGVNCLPKMSDKAVGDMVPEICSIGVGECCLTDNYCERCFSLQTRTIGVGHGSVLDTVQTELTTTPILTDVSLQPITPPQTPNTKNGAKNLNKKPHGESPVVRMFSDEYERVECELITDCTDGKLCKDSNSAREDILFTCKLLQRHFLNNDENLDEDKLLLCMKNIEDYWFTCVTDERLDKKSLADLIRVLEQHLPYLLDGIISSQDEHGNTALHYLVTYGKFDCVSELLKTNQCNVIITNKAGYSAVMLGSLKEAINPKDKVVLKRLLEKGNLNSIAQSTGQTALMLAAGTGNVDTVDLLLQCGASQSINTTDLDGSTALMCACEHGYASVVKRLLAVDDCDASIADHTHHNVGQFPSPPSKFFVRPSPPILFRLFAYDVVTIRFQTNAELDGSTCFSIAMEHNRKDIALMIYNHIQVQNSRTPNKKKSVKS